MELKRKLDIRSYQTAWLLLHKIRSAMASSQMFPLTSDVEIDETYIGGHRPGKRGRGAEGKSLVGFFVNLQSAGFVVVAFLNIPPRFLISFLFVLVFPDTSQYLPSGSSTASTSKP